ncbi:hypothetical protein M422DRAFT_241148 [Sphaerobolus stellatus SS14]|nr:hypothetical protein M422DRAFT_241148 [Sphaerobolus stellatus SS14]
MVGLLPWGSWAITKSQHEIPDTQTVRTSGYRYRTRLSVRRGSQAAGSQPNDAIRENSSAMVTTPVRRREPPSYGRMFQDDSSDSETNKSSSSVTSDNYSSDGIHPLNSDIIDNTPSRSNTQTTSRATFSLQNHASQREMPRPSSPEIPSTSDDIFDFLAQRQRGATPSHQSHPQCQGPLQTSTHKNKKTMRGSLQISSLNIRGGGSNATRDKWDHLWQVMRQNQVGILAVQESHISNAALQELENTFSSRLQILNSIGETNSKGVAFLLNKQLTAWKEAKTIEIIPGRALLLMLPWHNEQTLNILNIYAPNPHNENKDFWSNLHKKWQDDGLPMVHLMLGDFNMVEDSIDRLPAHNDPPGPREALAKFKSVFKLIDGWCRENPDTIAHTWHQNQRDIHSRIDRIYSNEDIFQHSSNWIATPPPILSDHDIVNVRVFNATMPYVGTGRWTIPLFILKEENIMKEIRQKGMQCLQSIESLQAHEHEHIQQIYSTFKQELINTIRNYAKKCIPTIQRQIKYKISQLEEVLKNTPDPVEKATLASDLKENIRFLEQKCHSQARQNTAVKFTLKDETLDPDWL